MIASVSALATPEDEGLPADFGKYRLVKRIATGGMAEIFLAHRHDSPLDPIVIKRILPHLVKSGEFVSMFLDEARIAAQLEHENVVRIEDVGQIDGAYYIAMEYVHGEDIRRIYNRAYKLQRSLPLSHSIRVIADAAVGLGYAHKLTDFAGRHMGVVHRDVSPQNILVTYDGEVKVVDFGIAKAANKVAQTRAGVLKGKYSYMSPEQALGDSIDHRTDIFALGIILYETTTGTRLFKRHNELSTLQAIIKCEFVPPSQALPGYPPALERVLLRALAKNPDDRYDDAEAFSKDLYEFLKSSQLFVERSVIAEFMRDLFADRLEEEEGSGLPALPDEDEVKEEMAETNASDSRRALQERKASAEDEPDHTLEDRASSEGPMPNFVEPPSERTDSGSQVRASLPERRKRTHVIRDTRETDGEEATGKKKRGEDSHEAPTVAAHPSYRPPTPAPALVTPQIEKAAYRPHNDKAETVAPIPDGIAPETRRDDRKRGEATEQVRARVKQALAADDATQEEVEPEQVGGGGMRWLFPLGILIGAVLVAVIVGIATSRFIRGDEPKTDPIAPTVGTSAVIEVATEPNAVVYADGRILGTADTEGKAGPYEVEPGVVLLNVKLRKTGFSSSRQVEVGTGKSYHFEIRAQNGFLKIAVAPWARVQIDGRDMGLTPLPSLQLSEGLHRVVLENPDIKKRHETTVKIDGGKTSELRLNLADVD